MNDLASSSQLSKRTRVILTIVGISSVAAVMLVVLGHVSRNYTVPAATASAMMTKSTHGSSSSSIAAARIHRVLAFGDSLTAGTSGYELYPYAPHLENVLQTKFGEPTVVVRHRGMPGWTTNDMLNDLDGERTGLRTAIKAVKDPSLSLVIILAGSNDIGSGATAEEITNNLLALHNVCFENGVPRTIAVAIPPSGYQSMVPSAAKLAQTVNDKLKAYAETHDTRVTYVPFPFAYENGGKNWFQDTLHFSEKGYQELGESLAPPVAQILRSMDEQGSKKS